MVHVVEETLSDIAYRENNQQLAKENNELKQQLALCIEDRARLIGEQRERDVKILALESVIRKLEKKVILIREIASDDSDRVLELETKHSDHHHQRRQELDTDSPIRALPSSCPSNASTKLTTPKSSISTASAISPLPSITSIESNLQEHHDDERSNEKSRNNESSSSTLHNCQADDNARDVAESATTTTSNNTSYDAARLETIIEENDSLIPRDVSSVPPLTLQPERTMHTPSIWNCLDPLDDPCMYESTPTRVPARLKESMKFFSPRPSSLHALVPPQPPTPVARKSESSLDKHSIPEDQENQNSTLKGIEIDQPRPKRGRGRMIRGESRAKRKVKFGASDTNTAEEEEEEKQEEEYKVVPEPRRYNLRKRSKI